MINLETQNSTLLVVSSSVHTHNGKVRLSSFVPSPKRQWALTEKQEIQFVIKKRTVEVVKH